MQKRLFFLFLFSTLFFSVAIFSEPVWVPAKINGQKGDLVFSASEDGDMVGDLIAVFGGYWNHSGMLMDDGYTIRHSILFVKDLKIDNNGCGVPYRLDPDGLSNGLPGFISEDVDSTYNNEDPSYNGFSLAGGVIVMPDEMKEDSYRQYLELAADKLMFLRGYYRVNAFINMMQMEDLNYMKKGVGNHCSGGIWFAHHYTGKTMNVATVEPDLVKACLESLYDSVHTMVEEKVGCGKVFTPDVASDVANQVVNTFGFDRSEDLSDYWRDYVQDNDLYAHGTAPDHLLLQSFTNPKGYNAGVQTETSSYYGKVVPVEWSDGYYVDDNDDGIDDGCN